MRRLLLILLLLAAWPIAARADCTDARAAAGENGPCVAIGGGSIRPAGGNNTDASANAQSLSGLNLLGTLAANATRKGYIVQVQDSAADCGGSGGNAGGLVVAFDDGAGGTATILILGYASAKGAQGGSLDMGGLPHIGRIRYYGTAGCQVGAGQW